LLKAVESYNVNRFKGGDDIEEAGATTIISTSAEFYYLEVANLLI
jgi:hypothetical protein